MENQLYEVIEVEGKDLGCVALKIVKKGTLILKEKPQFSAIEASESDEIWSKELFRHLFQNFQKMDPTDREEYLKLSSRHTSDELLGGLALGVSNGCDPTILNLMMKIHGIFETNKFKGGVGIQASRLVACPQLWSYPNKYNQGQ